MTHRRSNQNVRLGLLSLIVCLAATHADAQRSGDGIPTAQEIWQHLPPLPGSRSEAAPAAEPMAAPSPKPTAPTAPQRSLPADSDAPKAPSAAARPRAAQASAAVPSRTLAQARVVIHFSERSGYQRSQELVRLLRAAGTGEVETRPVGHPIEHQSIRYFYSADHDVSGIIGDLIGGGGRTSVSDFTHFRPLPRNGTIEIWVP